MKPNLFYWMKKRGSLLTLGLVAVLAASACAPAATNPTQAIVPVVAATSTPAAESIPAATGEVVATQAAVVQPVATSRGPNLEATDPATVALASGGLQLVEFFRFT